MQLLFILAGLLIFMAAPAFAQPVRSPFSQWEFNAPADVPICQIDGDTSGGHLTLRAPAEHTGAVALILSKSTWHIPKGTVVNVTMAFSDGTSMRLSGFGAATDATFELTTATLKPWLHGFTAGSTGVVTFDRGNEPSWKLELQGTTPAVNAMYRCVLENQFDLPAPFTDPNTQPFDSGLAPHSSVQSLFNTASDLLLRTPIKTPDLQVDREEFCRVTDLGSSKYKELHSLYVSEQNGVRSDFLVDEMHSNFVNIQNAVLKLMRDGDFRIVRWPFSVSSVASDKNALLKFSPENTYDIKLSLSIMCQSPAVMQLRLPGNFDMANFAAKLSVGSVVEVTGKFEKFPASTNSMEIKVERSITERGAMTNPEYTILLTDISLLK